jgi:hypothetical protein
VSVNITFKTKNNFFDRRAVIDYFGTKGKKTITALSRVGAFVRTRARSLLRKRKKIAPAGQAPSIHTSDTTITLRNIQFAYDFKSSSVVVGSVLTNSSAARSSTPVPKLLEIGGVITRKGQTLHYNKHPWMGPALTAEIAAGTIAPCWSAALKA